MTFLIFTGCDCLQCKEGIVIDAETKIGIPNVAIYKHTRPNQKSYTNESGFYEWQGVSGGFTPKCPEPKLYFIHPEYDTLFMAKKTSVVRLKKRTTSS